MHLQVHAWRLRQAARAAIFEGDVKRASELSSVAEALCHTAAGKALKELSLWITSEESGDPAIG